MSRFLRFLIGLALLASLGLGTIVHATERLCPQGVEASVGTGHVDGDADQGPADSENAYPHHHGGCHGHHVATPLDRSDAASRVSATGMHAGRPSVAVATAPADPALRPPIA